MISKHFTSIQLVYSRPRRIYSLTNLKSTLNKNLAKLEYRFNTHPQLRLERVETRFRLRCFRSNFFLLVLLLSRHPFRIQSFGSRFLSWDCHLRLNLNFVSKKKRLNIGAPTLKPHPTSYNRFWVVARKIWFLLPLPRGVHNTAGEKINPILFAAGQVSFCL